MSSEGGLDAIVSRAKEIQVNSRYSQKGHDEAAAVFKLLGTVEVLVAVVLSAGASGSLILSLGLGTGALAVMVAISGVIGIVYHTTNPSAKAARHRAHAIRFLQIGNEARTFVKVDCHRPDVEYGEARKGLARLQETYQKATADASPEGIPHWAYLRAKEGIEQGQASYTREELDA